MVLYTPEYASLLLIVFGIILTIIGTILIYQILKSEKIARPFLSSLMVYFFLMATCNFIQAWAFLVGEFPQEVGTIYNNYFCVVAIYLAPLWLIYMTEKHYFPQIKLISKIHIFSLVLWIFIGAFFALSFIEMIPDPAQFLAEYQMMRYQTLAIMIWFLEVAIIIFVFAYLALQSTDKYRAYSVLIAIAWFLNQAMNLLLQLPEQGAQWGLVGGFENTILHKSASFITVIFIFKYIGAIMTAYYLYKLYHLKEI